VTDGQTPSYAIVRSLDELEALGTGWDDLVLATQRPSPFLLHGWVAEWWREFGDGGDLAVATATRGGRLVGVLPVFVGRLHGLRVCQFLGAHESALGDLLVEPDEPKETAAGLVAALRGERYDYCDLFGLPGSSALAAASAGSLSLIQRVEAPVLLMPDGFEAAYNEKTSSKKRNLHRRRLRQLAEVGEVEFVEARTTDELMPLLEDSFQLHHLRWEGRPDGSTFGTERGRAFQRAAARRLGDTGVLRMVMMRVDGKPAAFHYFFELGSTMYVHRLAFDPALSRFSPGLVSTLETLRVASDDGMKRVEYLGGGERYKLELSDRLEPLQQAVGLARNPQGALATRVRVAAIGARKTLKRSERLQRLYLAGGFRRHAKRAGAVEEGH
jgi:CelD/BcsL family acetyltransferase involved in cellulose biosynthesis